MGVPDQLDAVAEDDIVANGAGSEAAPFAASSDFLPKEEDFGRADAQDDGGERSIYQVRCGQEDVDEKGVGCRLGTDGPSACMTPATPSSNTPNPAWVIGTEPATLAVTMMSM